MRSLAVKKSPSTLRQAHTFTMARILKCSDVAHKVPALSIVMPIHDISKVHLPHRTHPATGIPTHIHTAPQHSNKTAAHHTQSKPTQHRHYHTADTSPECHPKKSAPHPPTSATKASGATSAARSPATTVCTNGSMKTASMPARPSQRLRSCASSRRKSYSTTLEQECSMRRRG